MSRNCWPYRLCARRLLAGRHEKSLSPTVFDESVNNVPTVMVSAGKIGFQIECAPADLIKLTRAATAHITTD